MDAALRDQIRYYELLLAACRRRPSVHRAQIAALEAHLALCGRATTGAQFGAALEHGGHATALSRAHQLDRFAVDHARAVMLGDGLAATGAVRAMEPLAAAGDAAFPAAVAATGAAIGAAGSASILAEHASRLVEAAIDLACDWDAERCLDARHRARTAWMIARALAPQLGLAWLTAPPIRHRLPFTEAAGAALRQVLGAALGDPPDLDGTAPPTPPPLPPVPDFSAIAALGLDGWPPATDADPAHIAAHADALAAGEEAGAARDSAVAAITAARVYAGRCDEPALVQLADEALDGVAVANTAAEVQAWVSWHGEAQAIERRWWHLLVHVALWPVVAAIANPARARPAAVVAARLLGVDPVVALGAPAIARALARQVHGAGQTLDADRPIAGPGAPHVAVVRRAAAEHAVALVTAAAEGGRAVPNFAEAARRFASPAALIAHVEAVLTAAGAPRGGDGAVVYWGHTLPLLAVDDQRATVPRPRPEGL